MFGDLKSTFIGLDALGILRKDLIAALGSERAKGFLLRYGWQCGINDVKYLREKFLWTTEDDLLRAGYRINELNGYLKSGSVVMRADWETGKFYTEAYWNYSSEAQKHIEHFGYHDETVCATMIGYAGGYGTECLGANILFKEFECIGKGDPYCRWVGKTIDDWDEEIEDVLPFYESENLANELDRAYHRIEKQKEALKKALNINEKLSKVLIQGGGLSSIVKILAQSLGAAAVLEDKNYNLFESYGNYTPHEFGRFVDLSLKKNEQRVKRLIEEKGTVHVTVPGDFGWQHERLISPVLLRNEVCGYISLIKQQGVFDEMETISLERASTMCAIQFLQERTAIEREQRIKGEFLNELLSDKPDIENLSYRMKLLGYNLNKPHYVFVFNLEHTNEINIHQREPYLMELRRSIADTLESQLLSYGKGCLVASRLDKIIALIPQEVVAQMKFELKTFGEFLVNIISNNYADNKTILGISSLCKGIDTFRKGYEEANKSIIMAKRGRVTSNVISVDEMGSLGILLCTKDEKELESFATGLLKELLAYDEENNAELLKTLYYYMENQGNIQQTSVQMTISMGAIRYRLKRVQEISELDITSAKGFIDSYLALKILMFLGKWGL